MATMRYTLLALLTCWNVACATDYYVAQEDAQANDANPGTRARPFRTLGKACDIATAGDTVFIRQGVYQEALIPKHSGEKGKPIVFQAQGNDEVVIKGSDVLSGLDREGPHLWVKRPSGKKHDPTAPEANNRFLENTFLVNGADSRVAFGNRRFTSARALDAAAANARANRSASDLTQLDKATAERLNDALKRVLNALSVADARLDIRAQNVCLEAIWHLRGPGKATGYWLKAEKVHYLLLDVAAPGEIRLRGSGTPLLWDFPVLRAPIRTPLVQVGDVFTAQVEGPCALVIGLEADAHPVDAL